MEESKMSLVPMVDSFDGTACLVEAEGKFADRKSKATEEKIFVTVRLRPLNAKELAKNDFSVWECSDDKTVSFTYSMGERSNFPQSYVFDRVFGSETSTEEVYEKGAKDVALSALTGKNATIFAYGQTCSGKTYTMHGITESAAEDIFNYIKQRDDRVFLLKFSALEIYNEVANDLLNPESGSLRLMDDPERGTIIERLVEETVRDKDHLQNLLGICEAHRQVGETALNDISSRSHQIIRLTIESSPRTTIDERPVKSLIAVLNFVDLAGSERASLTQSEGTRLKEGCYINRSLLTLSTVIRKLSEVNKAKPGHVPYRESKLTRILQNSLGGNARTAIICTMSSSNRHVEQTRNTLFFASCAKEVTNRAQVNMVVSDKDLIKQLKREVSLLEAKLRLSTYSMRSSSDALLLEKDMQIQKMQDEMRKALQQRDVAQSQLDEVLKQMEASERARALTISVVDTPPLSTSDDHLYHSHSSDESFGNVKDLSCQVEVKRMNESTQLQNHKTQPSDSRQPTTASAVLLQEIHKLEHLQSELAQDANRALEAVQKEVECLRLAQAGMNQEAAKSVAKLQAEIHEIYESRVTGPDYPITKDLIVEENRKSISLKDEIQRIMLKEKEKFAGDYDASQVDLEKMLVNMHMSVEELGLSTHANGTSLKSENGEYLRLRNDPAGMYSGRNSVDGNQLAITKLNFAFDENTPPQAEENIRSVHAYVTDLKERVAKLQYQKQLLVYRVLELERTGNSEEENNQMTLPASPERWKTDFIEKQKQIFELWDACHVSIIHRSQFYILFRGEPADAIYIEVELRRLTWLRDNHLRGGPKPAGLEQASSPTSSMRALRRERESLVKYLKTRLTAAERDQIYQQWGISLDMKQRKVKLAYQIWTNPRDEEHIRMSAELVAKLVGLWNSRAGGASKEMFQLSFSPPSSEKTWFSSIYSLFSFRSA